VLGKKAFLLSTVTLLRWLVDIGRPPYGVQSLMRWCKLEEPTYGAPVDTGGRLPHGVQLLLSAWE
jgi:hypothetical protein